ncbi:hypothetical protein B0T22DRAFT_498103 [Podospora appendiculata]|uniref:Uncharacterized protein n=1 Tax=Podospora appendiculata TaxID=314037 RepID=A0AAE1CBU6_9PEZI|nr:hypothetical protein B0T22DRAFT_498103 [Podospora appendiculata]
MYVFFVFGVACAVAHHVFYYSLNDKPATDQVQMLRYGTILAFAAKAGLSAAVVSAYRQRVWTTVRRRLMSVAALDSLFAATEDLIALWNWELIKTARIAILLSAFVWLAPLVVILTANTLLVEPRRVVTNTTCPAARTLNLTFEETSEWRDPVKMDGLYEIPLSLWNTTKPADSDPPGWFDYYTGPSPNFARTATIGAFLERAVTRKNAQLETCGSGWNCSLEIKFTAPGYKCTELANGVGSKAVNLTQESGSIAPPFDIDILLPRGPYTYYAFATGGEYSTTQMKDVGIGGIPNTKPPYPQDFGAFRTEPIIWIGYTELLNPDEAVPSNSSDPAFDTAFIPKLFACEHYESVYTVTLNYTDAVQSTKVTNITFLHPVINTTYIADIDANDGTADNVTATPKDNYIHPTDVHRYRRVAAYHSLGYMLRFFINGTVEMDKSLVNPIVNTDAIQTKLLDPRNNYFPFPNLPDLIQEFYEDMILSMLSNPLFAGVVWAARPDEQSGARLHGGDGADQNPSDYLYPCTKSRLANMYQYNVRDLWIVYTIAIMLSLLGVVTGACAIRENDGVVRDTRFSSIVAATRGPALEKVRWDGVHRPGEAGDDDAAHVPGDVKRLKVGYGLVGGDDGSGVAGGPGDDTSLEERPWSVRSKGQKRYGFGLEGDVQQIKREGSIWKFPMSE